MNRHRKNRRIAPSQKQPEDSRSQPPSKRISTPVTLSYQYVEPGGQFCLSHCEMNDVKETADCLRQLTTKSWQEVLSTGGKGGRKQGLGFTPYQDSALRHVQRPARLDPTIRIAAVRATQKMRIFGAYLDHVFYLIWFDPGHKIVPAD